MSTVTSKSAGLQRLQVAIGTVAIAVFWRRYARTFLPAALSSLSERWSTLRLRDALDALPSPLSDGVISPALSLSRTWSRNRLGRFFAGFRVSTAADDESAAVPFSSWCDFQEDSLHHPAWGYYCDGRVEFGEHSDTSDFTTFPVSMRPAFGAMLADRLHALWAASCAS